MDKYIHEVLRKTIHVSSLWMVAIMYFLSKIDAVLTFGIFSLLILAVEYLRHRNSLIKKVFIILFGKILREKEVEKTMTGAAYFVLSALIVSMIFPKEIAITSFSVMIISDTAAALIGKKFGKTLLIDDKTLQGTQAFFISAVITIICLINFFPHDNVRYLTVFLAAATGTLAELFSKRVKIDDNLLVPLVVGAILLIFK